MNMTRIYFAASLVAAGLVTASAMQPVSAADAAPDGASATPGPHGWGGRGHHGHWGPGLMFRHLGLTDAQKASVKSILEQNEPELQSLHQQTHTNSRKLWTILPNDPNYASVVASVSQANAGLLSQEITLQANIRAQLYGVLTPAQQSQLATNLANMQARVAAHAGRGTSVQ